MQNILNVGSKLAVAAAVIALAGFSPVYAQGGADAGATGGGVGGGGTTTVVAPTPPCAKIANVSTQNLGVASSNFTISFNVTNCSNQTETLSTNFSDLNPTITGADHTCLYAPWALAPVTFKPGETKGFSTTQPKSCDTTHFFAINISDPNTVLATTWYAYFIQLGRFLPGLP